VTEFAQLDALRGGNGLVRLIGHRGARGIMPENTMEGFAFTTGIGVDVLEFDVVLTQDRVPVITHNHHLARSATRTPDGAWLTGAEPRIADMTLAEVQAMDIGGLDGRTEYGQRFPDQVFLSDIRVPRLTELLRFAGLPENEGLHLLLELKSDPEVKKGSRAFREVVSTVVREVRAFELGARTILHSFDWELLDECRTQAPEMPTSYLSQLPKNSDELGEDSSQSVGPDFETLSTSLPQAVRDAGGQMWCPYFMDVTPALVSEAQALGLLVTAWTANEVSDIEAMIDAGVDGIVTDYPGRVQHCLLNRGMGWQ